jgi:hypothetical protein
LEVRALVTLSASLVMLLVAGADAAVTADAARECGAVRAPRFRVPARFLTRGSVGLWLPYRGRCLLRVVAGAGSAEPLFRLRAGERVVGLQWAPSGRHFVLVTRRPRRALLLGSDGRLVKSWRAGAAAFLADGRLVLGRDSGLYVVRGGRLTLLVRRAALERAARFRSASGPFGPDPWGNNRGYGRRAVALQWWSGQRDAVLVARVGGRASRASPALPGYSNVGGSAWTPDGLSLLEFTVFRAPPGFNKDHDHCLDVWAGQSIRHVFCVSGLARPYQFHFDKLLWSNDGRSGLLNDGTVISPQGRVLGLAAGAGDPAFAVLWQPRG